MPSFKVWAFWPAIILAFLFAGINGLLLGDLAGRNAKCPPNREVHIWHEILPSPVYYPDGKRGPLGALSPESLRAIEMQSAKDYFAGEGRDPFVRLK